MKKTITCILISISSILLSFSQPTDRVYSRQEYINKYKNIAIKEMYRTGIPASITIAQGILESGDGNSPLARYAFNHFGIKCHDWQGATFIQDDDAKNECFRKYSNPNQSFHDHSEFLSKRSRYAFLFNLKPTDYVGWAKGLKKAGYATNPKYPALLIKIIEDNNLSELDNSKPIPTKKIVATNEKNKSIKTHKTAPPKTDNSNIIKKHPNNINYTLALKGDTPEKIAKRFNLGGWQIATYNDLDKNSKLNEDELIFLQPKRKKSKIKTHKIKTGENLRYISQKYGVKMKYLCKYNSITKYSELKTGTLIKLR